MDNKTHWEAIYKNKLPIEVGWYEPHLTTSLDLISRCELMLDAHLIDVGGGASTLVDDLLNKGFKHITVLDISSEALNVSRIRLGDKATKVEWMAVDIKEAKFTEHYYNLWHDRAVFHFLTLAEDRRKYIEQVSRALKLGGYLMIGAFGPKAPPKCSGLDVIRYSPEMLQMELGEMFKLIESKEEIHLTPKNFPQQYIYCLFQKSQFKYYKPKICKKLNKDSLELNNLTGDKL